MLRRHHSIIILHSRLLTPTMTLNHLKIAPSSRLIKKMAVFGTQVAADFNQTANTIMEWVAAIRDSSIGTISEDFQNH